MIGILMAAAVANFPLLESGSLGFVQMLSDQMESDKRLAVTTGGRLYLADAVCNRADAATRALTEIDTVLVDKKVLPPAGHSVWGMHALTPDELTDLTKLRITIAGYHDVTNRDCLTRSHSGL